MTALVRRILPEWALEYARFRELFFFLVWRDVKIRYKQTVLGASWAVIQPLMMTGVLIILSGMARIDTEGMPAIVFYYSANVPWWVFSNGVPLSGNSLVTNSKLISKVYFPRAIIPSASVLAGVVDFTIASVLLFGMMFYFHVPIGLEMLFWPVMLIPVMLLVVSIGMFFSALNVKYRDVKYTISFFVQLMFFLSGVIAAPSSVPEKFQPFMRLNPMVAFIDGFRAAVNPARSIDWGEMGIGCGVVVAVFVCAVTYFRRSERAFADLI